MRKYEARAAASRDSYEASCSNSQNDSELSDQELLTVTPRPVIHDFDKELKKLKQLYSDSSTSSPESESKQETEKTESLKERRKSRNYQKLMDLRYLRRKPNRKSPGIMINLVPVGFRRFWNSLELNAEPVIFLTSLSMGIWSIIVPTFMYWSQCIDIFSNEPNSTELCEHLSQKGHSNLTFIDNPQEEVVQLQVATLHMYMRIFRCAPAIVASIMLGAWSDSAGGRKRPLMIAFIGPAIANIIVLYCTLFYTQQSIFWLFVLEETVAGLTGAGMCEHASLFSMVTDTARGASQDGESEITFRVSLATGMDAFGMVTGVGLASIIGRLATNRSQGYIVGALAFTLSYFATLLYTKLYVKETFKPAILERDKEEKVQKNVFTTLIYIVGLAVNRVKSVKEMLLAPRLGWRRLCLIVTVAAIFVEVLTADNGLLLLFVKRPPLEWSDTQFSTYAVYVSFLNCIGKLFAWPLLIKVCRLRGLDTLMILGGLSVSVCSYLLLSISTTTKMIYAVGTMHFFHGMMGPGFRGMLSKLVRIDETARLYTAIGVTVQVAPIFSSLVFNNIYKATLHFWGGFAFFVCAMIQIAVLLTIGMVHFLMLRSESGAAKDDTVRLDMSYEHNNADSGDVQEWTDAIQDNQSTNRVV